MPDARAIGQTKIRAGDGRVEGYLATVDPSNGQSKRFAADEIGELRLPGVQDLVFGDARILDQVAKQGAVGFVALGPLRGAYQVEVSLQWRQRQKIIIDVGHHRQSVTARQLIQSTDDIVVKEEAREGLEVAIDQPAVGRHLEVLKGLGEREFADLPIQAIWAPIVRDISMFPMFPERLDIKMMRTGIGQDALKGTVGTVANADQRTEDIERHQLRPQTCRVHFAIHKSNSDDALVLNECALPHAAWLTARRWLRVRSGSRDVTPEPAPPRVPDVDFPKSRHRSR